MCFVALGRPQTRASITYTQIITGDHRGLCSVSYVYLVSLLLVGKQTVMKKYYLVRYPKYLLDVCSLRDEQMLMTHDTKFFVKMSNLQELLLQCKV